MAGGSAGAFEDIENTFKGLDYVLLVLQFLEYWNTGECEIFIWLRQSDQIFSTAYGRLDSAWPAFYIPGPIFHQYLQYPDTQARPSDAILGARCQGPASLCRMMI